MHCFSVVTGMTTKILLVAIATLMPATLLAAQTTVTAKDSADQQIHEWLKARAARALAEHNVETARGSAGQKGRLRILSLADMDAPASITSSVLAGIDERRKGPLRVPAGAIPSTTDVVGGLTATRRNSAELQQRPGPALADVSRTPLAAAERVHTAPSGSTNGGTWTGVSRTYRLPQVGVIILSEDDYHASGTELTVIRETLNEDVNGVPAIAYSARSEDGRGKADIRWVTAQRAYALTLLTDDGSRIEQDQALLLQIARGIQP